MFSLKDKFEFLEDGVDFPFYNDIPKLSRAEWLIVLLSPILMLAIVYWSGLKDPYESILEFLVTVIPALYICKGSYGLFFKKIRLKDIKLIILVLFADFLYSGIMGYVMEYVLKYHHSTSVVVSNLTHIDLMFIVSNCLSLLAEEFLKIFILLLVMYVIYKLTENRRLSIGIGIIVTLFIFGMSHYSAYSGKILQILVMQGLGSLFDLYAYMKTKNILVSYIIHLLQDFIVFFASVM